MKKLLCMLLAAVMVLSMVACEEVAPAAEAPAAESSEPAVDANVADYKYEVPAGESYDLAQYYKDADFDDCHSTYTGMGGTVWVPDDPTTSIPKANKKYTIGFSVYYTVDEVGAMILDNMKKFAEEAGVELLVNDANYDAQMTEAELARLEALIEKLREEKR